MMNVCGNMYYITGSVAWKVTWFLFATDVVQNLKGRKFINRTILLRVLYMHAAQI